MLMLPNIAYIGHRAYRGIVEQWHNHTYLYSISEDLFMYAFNALSKIDFYGESNPDYRPYRTYNRHKLEERTCPPATYSGLVFSNSVPGKPYKLVTSKYLSHNNNYAYVLMDERHTRTVMSIHAKIFDPIVDELLLKRLRATTIDDAAWEALEEIVGGLEAGNSVAFASGMAAIASVFDQISSDAVVVIPDDCYQGIAGLAMMGQKRDAGL